MYAVIEIGTKQYKVEKGDVIEVEKLTVAEGTKEIAIEKVLLLAKESKLEVGKPYIKGANATIEILGDFKAPKVMSFKYKRRKSTHWKKGHRQQLTRVKIKEITPA
jgi:large subunit ribosomal protein L21